MSSFYTSVPDDYRHFESHIHAIDFDKPVFDKLGEREPYSDEEFQACRDAADEISYQLLRLYNRKGKRITPHYWNDPKFEGKDPLDIEIEILREQRRGNYGYDTPYGLPAYVHGLRAMKLIFPDTHITPVLADIVHLSFLGYTYNRKYLHLLGSMDAGKSSSTARIIYLFMLIDVSNTFAVVATPLVESANMTIFGDVTELFDQICEHHPIEDDGSKRTSLWPHAGSTSERRMNFVKQAKNQKGGWIAHRSLKKEGVGVGSKGKGSDPRFGHGLFVFDEINKVESFNFEKDLANLAGQAYFQMHSTQNPWDEQDIGGQMATPKPWHDWGWNSYKEIREDQPIIWPTVKGGIAYRIDGLDSVNMVLQKIVYPWQFHRGKHDKVVEDYGRESPEYWSQVRGIFPGGDIDMRLLSQARVAASRFDDDGGFTMQAIHGRVLFCDPAHTGQGDKAVVTTLEFGPSKVTNTDGTIDLRPMLVARHPQHHVKFIKDLYWTGDPGPEHLTELEFLELGGDLNDITVGAPITYEQQIAIYMARRARAEVIPYSNVGFDYSMRPDMIEAVRLVMGNGPVAFDYSTKAIGYELQATKENTADRFSRPGGRTDELLFLAADVFRSKQLRGGQYLTLAALQLQQTRIIKEKPWKPAEKKADFKARNGNKSPDERDSFAGAVGMALLRGFRTMANKVSGIINRGSIFSRSKEKQKNHRKTAKPLPG